jgi:hypothetical protein
MARKAHTHSQVNLVEAGVRPRHLIAEVIHIVDRKGRLVAALVAQILPTARRSTAHGRKGEDKHADRARERTPTVRHRQV